MRYIQILVLFIITNSNALAQKKVNQKDLKTVRAMLMGAFNSSDQAKTDSDFFDIRLHMVPIWTSKQNGYWLYVEQAVASALNRPYRQRVYHLTLLNDSVVVSHVYTPKNPMQYAGGWYNTEKLKQLQPDSLDMRGGCDILLKKQSKKLYTGSTNNRDCSSNLKGAVYATSEVILTPNTLTSWDRGWDENGIQVWGAVKGGYIFKKETTK